MITYFLLLQVLNPITQKLGVKLTIIVGLFCIFIGALFIPPIGIFPQSTLTICIGLLILGIPGACINIPAICDLIDTLKKKNKNLDDNVANDMGSAIYNLGINFGEAAGPFLGGYITEKSSFKSSAIFTSFMALFYGVFFTYVNRHMLMKKFQGGEESERKSITRRLTDDGGDYYKAGKTENNMPIEYVGRYRSYSYSRRSSKRSSFAQ
jgi:MFS family permease